MVLAGNEFRFAFLAITLTFHTALPQENTSPSVEEISVVEYQPAFVAYTVHSGPDWSLGSAFREASERMGRIENAGPLFARRYTNGITHIGFFTSSLTVAPDGFTVKAWRAYRAATVRVVGPYGTMSRHADGLREWVSRRELLAGDLIEIYPQRVDGESIVELRLVIRDRSNTDTETPAEPVELAETPLASTASVEENIEQPAHEPSPEPELDIAPDQSLADLITTGEVESAATKVLPDYLGHASASRRWAELVRDRVRVLRVLIERKHGAEVEELGLFIDAVAARSDTLSKGADLSSPTTLPVGIDRSVFLDELDKLIVHVHIKTSDPDDLRKRIIDLFQRIATINNQHHRGASDSLSANKASD